MERGHKFDKGDVVLLHKEESDCKRIALENIEIPRHKHDDFLYQYILKTS